MGVCKDERRVCVCFYGIRWSALILSPHVRSRHDPPPRPYICILPLNSQAPCKTLQRWEAERRERERDGEEKAEWMCLCMQGRKGGRKREMERQK